MCRATFSLTAVSLLVHCAVLTAQSPSRLNRVHGCRSGMTVDTAHAGACAVTIWER
jgi:hypothetical protein